MSLIVSSASSAPVRVNASNEPYDSLIVRVVGGMPGLSGSFGRNGVFRSYT